MRRPGGTLTVFAMALLAVGSADPPADDLTVTVTNRGRPVPGATVCAGTAEDYDAHGRAVTTRSGRARLTGVPSGPLIVSAALVGLAGRVERAAGESSVTVELRRDGSDPCEGGRISVSPSPSPVPSDRPVYQPPDPSGARPPAGRLRRPGRARVDPRVEHCFGALGAQCGGAQEGLPTTALCAFGTCRINAGSWEHDECCWANPQGMACQAGPLDAVAGHDGSCVAEWDKALSRLAAGYNWSRQIDFSRGNTTGRVVHSRYCARSGAMVHRDDIRYCCSRRADRPGGMVSRTRPDARICR